jgi:hypothetical protein
MNLYFVYKIICILFYSISVMNTQLLALYISLNLTWWSGPLLCMACTSPPHFLFLFYNKYVEHNYLTQI